MSSSATAKRPVSVTIVVVLTAALAVVDIVSGAALVVGAPEADRIAGLTAEQTATVARAIGGGFVAMGVVYAIVAVQLARRSNAARLVLSILLVARQAQAWFLVSELGTRLLEGSGAWPSPSSSSTSCGTPRHRAGSAVEVSRPWRTPSAPTRARRHRREPECSTSSCDWRCSGRRSR